MLYYLLHQIIPQEIIINELGEDVSEYGKRNCLLFIIGSFLYVVVWFIIQHYSLTAENKAVFINMNTAFMYIVVIDLIAMAFLYKSYFGRSIINEAKTEDTEVYNTKTHKYEESSKSAESAESAESEKED